MPTSRPESRKTAGFRPQGGVGPSVGAADPRWDANARGRLLSRIWGDGLEVVGGRVRVRTAAGGALAFVLGQLVLRLGDALSIENGKLGVEIGATLKLEGGQIVVDLGSNLRKDAKGALEVKPMPALSDSTDSTGGTAGSTLSAAMASGDDAVINNNFATLAAELVAVKAAMRANGLLDE